MAIVKNSIVLQDATGTIGEFVIKNFRGKKVLGKKPPKHKVSKSKAAVAGRSNLASTVLISKNINSFAPLKDIWAISDIEASSPYQKMMSINLKKVSNGLLTTSNLITPGGIPLKLNSAVVQNNILELNFNFPVVDNIRFPANLFLFLHFNNYNGTLLKINSEIAEAAPGGNYNENIPIEGELKKAFKADANPIIYIAVVGAIAHKKKEYWTETASAQI